MDEKRKQRYRQKINFITEKINDIPEPFDTQIKIDATLYRVQTTIDACMDIIAMLVKDKGRDVGDDYINIHILQKLKVFDKKLSEDFATLNGLRNAIVHKYNSFEEQTVINDIPSIQETITQFLERVEHELNSLTKKNSKRPAQFQ